LALDLADVTLVDREFEIDALLFENLLRFLGHFAIHARHNAIKDIPQPLPSRPARCQTEPSSNPITPPPMTTIVTRDFIKLQRTRR
jgi:hypothetical protein